MGQGHYIFIWEQVVSGEMERAMGALITVGLSWILQH